MENVGALPLQLPDLNGNIFSLSDMRGNVVVVNFWATWCSPCIEEFPSMLKFLKHFNGKVSIVAVSLDEDKDDIINFISAFKGNNVSGLYVLQDKNMSVSKKWGSEKIPESYIFDRNHRLVKKIASSENWAQPMVYNYFENLTKILD